MSDRNLFRRRLAWVFTCLVFFAVPLLLLVTACQRQWSRQERLSLEKTHRRLDQTLLRLRQREDPERYLAELFQALQTMSWGPQADRPREEILRKGLSSLRRRFPGVFSVITVDANGDLLSGLSDGPASRVLSRRLFLALLKEKRRELRPGEAREIWGALLSFIGPQADMNEVFSTDIILRKAHHTNAHAYFFPAFDDGGALFFHVNRTSDWKRLALNDRIRQMLAWNPHTPWTAGVAEPGSEMAADAGPAEALQRFSQTLQPYQRSAGRIYSIMTVSDGSRLWVSLPEKLVVSYEKSRRILAFVAILIFCQLVLYSARMEFGSSGATLPIRWRLVLLFGFSTGLPLGVLWLTGWEYLDHLERVRTRETYEEIERQLWTFDSRFRQLRHYIERKLTLGIVDGGFHDSGSQTRTKEKLIKLAAEFETTDLMVFDNRGRLVWKYPERFHLQKEAASRLLGEITGQLCAQLNNETGDQKLRSTELLLETLHGFGGGLDVIGHLAATLGTVTEFSSGMEKAWVFLARFYDRPNHVSHMVLFNWRKTDLEKMYLQRSLLTAEREWSGLRLLAYNAQGTVRSFTPPFHPLIKPAFPVMLEQRQKETTVFRPVTFLGDQWLACALKPKELGDYYLCGAHSFAPIREEINRWRSFYWLFTLVLCTMTVFLGLMLSQRFLAPVRELSLGVSAIDRRDFKHRVPAFAPDELGRLASTFNRVMEGLSDLEVGRIVQENLFPREELRIGPYRVFGRSWSATALGGDYFDLRLLVGDRALILIGDVTGHGVPAALVMALAKGVVELLCERNAPPEEMLRALNHIIFKTMRRKRMMSCFLAVLDAKKHELQIANAGHCYPILLRTGDPPRDLVNRQVLLGARADTLYKTDTVELKAGDRVFFYTDGLVETRTTRETIGYPAMSQEVPALFRSELSESCVRIFDWVESQRATAEQEDDITLLLLWRETE